MKTTGNRVYWIDRECYVIYMGKADRKYRPFLRVGTSEYIPRDIRRHIGSVVLTDRMTGNYFLEAECLEKPVSHHMHYVGSPDLVDAVRHFIRNEKIAEQPLSPGGDAEKEEGGRVVFYSDGNLRIFLDGHRLFDLLECEKTDAHAIHLSQRLQDVVSRVRGGYHASDFSESGFLLLGDGTPLLFRDGVLQSLLLDKQTLAGLARAMVPVELLQRFAGVGQREALLNLCKWRFSRELPLEFVLDSAVAANAGDGPEGQAAAVLALMQQAGASCSLEDPVRLPAAIDLSGGPDKDGLALYSKDRIPGSEAIIAPGAGFSWESAAQPPLLKNVPYRIVEDSGAAAAAVAAAESESVLRRMMGSSARKYLADYRDLSARERRDLVRGLEKNENLDDISVLAALLYCWNERIRGSDIEDVDMLASAVEAMQQQVGMPLRAELHVCEGELTAVFRPLEGVSRGAVNACNEARAKIDRIMDVAREQERFQKERERLSEALRELLAAREVKPVAAPPISAVPGNPGGGSTPVEQEGEQQGEQTMEEHDDEARRQMLRGIKAQYRDRHSGLLYRAEVVRGAFADQDAPHAATAAAPASDTGGQPRAEQQEPPRDENVRLNTVQKEEEPDRRRSYPFRYLAGAAAVLLAAGVALILFLSGVFSDPVGADRASGDPAGDEAAAVDAAVEDEAAGDSDEAADETGEATDVPDSNAPDSSATAKDSGDPAGIDEPDEDDAAAASARASTWGIMEVLRVTNWIAHNNGYALLGESAVHQRNPDWIYPGNSFMLPDGERHRVRLGDSIWRIAEDFLTDAYESSRMEREEFRAFIENLSYNQDVRYWEE